MHGHQVLEASNGEQAISLVEQAKTVQLENFANQFQVRGVVFCNQNFAHLAISASILLVYMAQPPCSSVPSVVKICLPIRLLPPAVAASTGRLSKGRS